jgi:hypothetical protein
MARLLILPIIVGGLLWGLYWFSHTPATQVTRVLRRLALWGGVGLLVIATLSGRLNPIFAALAAAIPVGFRILNLLHMLPMLQRVLRSLGLAVEDGADGEARDGREAPGSGGQGTAGAMTRDDALAILGLDTGAEPEQIRAAHRRLMQKLHPDRGGSDYLAAQINAAKTRLLGD